ncbi:hypothetical protein EASAB2608_06342 [Streptomyces sp. EAS-AB2608]|nr:hypothetical protein EASAB2608_06342 [Streptomyces sp. EAS-AB2608]
MVVATAAAGLLRPPVLPGCGQGGRPLSGAARRTGAGVALALLSACCFGTGGAATKVLGEAGLTPVQISQARLSLAGVPLLAVALIRSPRGLRVAPRDWPVLAALGAGSFAGVQTLCAISVARIPVGVYVVLQFLAPVIVVVWLRLLRGVRQPAPVWLGTALVVTGLLLVGQVWSGLRLDGVGVLTALGAAVALSLRFLLAGRALARRDATAVTALGVSAGAVVVDLARPVGAFPYRRLGAPARVGEVTVVPVWAVLLWTAVVSTLLACLCALAAQRFLAPATASVLSTVEVVAGSGTGLLLLGERVTAVQGAGIGAVLVGAALAQLRAGPTRTARARWRRAA